MMCCTESDCTDCSLLNHKLKKEGEMRLSINLTQNGFEMGMSRASITTPYHPLFIKRQPMNSAM